MAYSAEISRANPTCFLFLIDQSGSMQDVVNPSDVQKLAAPVEADGRTYTHSASGRTKAQFVADAINTLLQSLVLRCAREEGIRNYFDLGVIGYGQSVVAGLNGPLAGKELVSISEVGNNPARIEERSKKVEDGVGGLVDQKIKKPVWFDPISNGGTPMCQAFRQATETLKSWVASHQTSFPPSVIHITDGESTDGDPTSLMSELTSLSTTDGKCVLYNLHISASAGREVVFPDSAAGLPDQYANMLFSGASPLVPAVRAQAAKEGMVVGEGSRGFVLNGQPLTVIQALDIGTKPSNLR